MYARKLGHLIAFGVTAFLMLVVNAFMVYTLKNRPKRPHRARYGPLYCTAFAAPLILADLIRHVLQDQGVWPEGSSMWSSSEYRSGTNLHEENLTHLTFMGWLFTIIFTYTGFILLAVGVGWNANILKKIKLIRQKWRALRNGKAKKAKKAKKASGDAGDAVVKVEA